jgi:signal transduction histidine kinase
MKSDFVSYVSHELRTPLTSIKMFTDILKSRTTHLNPKARGHVRIIEEEADRLARMVTTILDSARIEQGAKEYHPAEADLCRLAKNALQTMAFQLKQHGFRVKTRFPSGAVHVMADTDAVTQAVLNLIANAIKYSAEKKQLTVAVARAGALVSCSVSDRGRGIPEESIPHLFERFYRDPTVKQNVEGVGLGLPLVKHIMAAHNGSVEVSSTVGVGSTFRLVFPALVNSVNKASRKGRKSHEHHPRH